MDTFGDGKATVEEMVLEGLGVSDLPSRADDLVTAALLGDEELSAVISADGEPGPRPKPTASITSTVPARVYLQSVLVEGCRGHGPLAAPPEQPTPGRGSVA